MVYENKDCMEWNKTAIEHSLNLITNNPNMLKSTTI